MIILFFVFVLSAWLFISAAVARFALMENEWRSVKDYMVADPFPFLFSDSRELAIFDQYESEFLCCHSDHVVETPFLIVPFRWRHLYPYDWLDPTWL